MMDNSESVDFDFFETPREESSPKGKQPAGKPPSAPKHDRVSSDRKNANVYSDDSLSSDSDSELQVIRKVSEKTRQKGSPDRTPTKNDKSRKYSDSESSSAYSNSDFSSDNSDERTPTRKEKIQVKIPKVQAWSLDAEEDVQDTERNGKANGDNSPRESRRDDHKKDKRSNHRNRKSISSESSDSDSSNERYRRKSDYSKSDRVKSAKNRNRKQDTRKALKSNSSYSNNSDITDVSPLESPEASPRERRKYNNKQHRGYSDEEDVQYRDKFSPEKDADIKLDSDKIDLSILMKCMADIDAEKQQRLKSSSRRVMFAPPNERSKQNYSFTMDRAKMIEKENQRLLKQIMNNIGTSKPKSAASVSSTRTPKKAVQPVMNRLTPSALNRQREQRRIESENMHILHRLQTIRPTPGMSKTEQFKEFEKTATFGVPGKTMIVSGGGTSRYHTLRQQEMHSSLGIPQRSRPGSAKSNASVPGKRSRPSSAKSDVSMRSNASMRSNTSMRSTASKRSTMSMRSNASIRSDLVRKMSDGRVDRRPQWDDRFSVS